MNSSELIDKFQDEAERHLGKAKAAEGENEVLSASEYAMADSLNWAASMVAKGADEGEGGITQTEEQYQVTLDLAESEAQLIMTALEPFLSECHDLEMANDVRNIRRALAEQGVTP